ncbi:hypothetical protein [Bacillus sp. T33-2]|uniref:hypothetical protein n=1 Tax=Bacillus sp. T33-2 TaxID=2054168 RepID=UPI000C790999|nr:hypothetical protein [Bacillus sp. T33-2]PLR93173.1 hypothetical protein CVD19_19390 [Bacillus sp. T33-2]
MSKILNVILVGFTFVLFLIVFPLFLFYSSFHVSIALNNPGAIVTDNNHSAVSTDGQQINKNNATEKNILDKFLESRVSGILFGSLISTTVTLILYYLNRRNAKRQLIFDIALKNLLPAVYMPILGELRLHKVKNKDFNFHHIEHVIIENGALINFAPKDIRKILDELFILCKSINSPDVYKNKETELKLKIEILETEIMKRFGALIG